MDTSRHTSRTRAENRGSELSAWASSSLNVRLASVASGAAPYAAFSAAMTSRLPSHFLRTKVAARSGRKRMRAA